MSIEEKPHTLQKVTFHAAKGGLLSFKRPPFGFQKAAFQKSPGRRPKKNRTSAEEKKQINAGLFGCYADFH